MSATPRRGVPSGPGDAARRLALDALLRIDQEGAYANLVLPGLLARSSLDQRDRGFVTELVYGTTRMRRACDWLVDRFVMRDLDPPTRMALRLGAYQLVFLDTPAHAAVSATVGVAPTRSRGLVNAVLRRVASAPRDWPDEGTRLSYPDWIIERLTTDLGEASAVEALEAMNERAVSVERDDGYHQDPASQWVAAEVCAEPGEVVLDLCAGPGGKATLLAATGALVVATDSRPA
ncbi:MAG: transcription antitermination factor NusB, partial [Acidimicrobiales bacterium]